MQKYIGIKYNFAGLGDLMCQINFAYYSSLVKGSKFFIEDYHSFLHGDSNGINYTKKMGWDFFENYFPYIEENSEYSIVIGSPAIFSSTLEKKYTRIAYDYGASNTIDGIFEQFPYRELFEKNGLLKLGIKQR